MISRLRAIPPHARSRVAAALESGHIGPKPTPIALASVLGGDQHVEEILSGLIALEELGVTGVAAGAWLRTLDQAMASASNPDLVWSGPGVPGLHARDTRRVYEELITSAQDSIWVSTYAFFDGPKAFELIARQLDEKPGLRVTLLLNIQRKRGDTSASEQVVRRFANHFWRVEWPGMTRPQVFYDPRSIEMDGPTGVLHAKAVVIDRRTTFITSANLTEAALDRNVELGVLVADPPFALTVTGYFQGLIDRGLLTILPNS